MIKPSLFRCIPLPPGTAKDRAISLSQGLQTIWTAQPGVSGGSNQCLTSKSRPSSYLKAKGRRCGVVGRRGRLQNHVRESYQSRMLSLFSKIPITGAIHPNKNTRHFLWTSLLASKMLSTIYFLLVLLSQPPAGSCVVRPSSLSLQQSCVRGGC